MNPQLIKIPSAKYHADEIGHTSPSLSASVATILVSQSPFHAYLAHPKLGNVRRECTPAMARGSLIHALVFNEPLHEFMEIDADNYRTKAAQQQRDDAIEGGLTPILLREITAAREITREIRAVIEAAGFSLDGQSEMSAMWEEETSHGPLSCRARMDHVHLDAAVILDLKTCQSAHPKAIARSMIDHGYDVQYAAYTSAIRKLNPDMAGREDFAFLFIEELPEGSPNRVLLTVARPDGSMKEHGRARWERACELWAACLKSGVWPGYGSISVAAPNWALAELSEASA